jgi:chemotaxis protein MotB
MSAPTPPPVRPIIIRRAPEAKAHGHHGGGWKVAYADFVTAMMAFFLLLWLVGSADKNTLKGLAEFFSDAKVNTGRPGGAGGVLQGYSMTPVPLPASPTAPFEHVLPPDPLSATDSVAFLGSPEQSEPDQIAYEAGYLVDGKLSEAEAEEFAATEATIRQALASVPDLKDVKDNLVVDHTQEGLRIQLLDLERVAMFPVGSDVMYPHTKRLIEVIVAAIEGVPNRLSIRGHADALPFAPGAAYDNWSLSSDRANATRQMMVRSGLDPQRVAEVVGKGDADPLLPEQVHDPRNRRISIVLLR